MLTRIAVRELQWEVIEDRGDSYLDRLICSSLELASPALAASATITYPSGQHARLFILS
jgi:hypothetical protein